MPKVSVIVPVYKVEKYLNRCLESIVSQTLSDIEIILVDDGSPDGSPAMCDEWAAKDSRIKVIHKANAGLGFARNSGIDIATGDFVGFVDSDDYIACDMYEKLYDAAIKNSAELAMTGFCCVGGIMVANENDVSYINCFDEDKVFSGKEGIDELMLNVSGAAPTENQDSKYGFASTKNIFSKKIIDDFDIRFQSEREVMSEDVFFVLEFLNHIECACGIKGAHYFYCRNDDSLSKSYRADRFEKSLLIIDEMNRQLDTRMPQFQYKIYTDRLLQAYARADCMQEIQFAKQNGYSKKELNAHLEAITKNEKLRQVLATYPISKLPKTQSIFAFTMKHNLLWLMKILVKLKK